MIVPLGGVPAARVPSGGVRRVPLGGVSLGGVRLLCVTDVFLFF